MGSIENMLGLSAGYLAKLRHDESRKNISADIMFQIADILNISVDYLAKVECDGLNDYELDIIAMFEKIKKDTLNNKCKWVRESANAISIKHGHIGRLLINECDNYVSLFRDGEFAAPNENSYILEIKKKVFLALVRIKTKTSYAGDEVEVYIFDERELPKVNKLCTTVQDQSSMLNTAIETLYYVAESSGKKLVLDDDMSKFVKDFMKESDIKYGE